MFSSAKSTAKSFTLRKQTDQQIKSIISQSISLFYPAEMTVYVEQRIAGATEQTL